MTGEFVCAPPGAYSVFLGQIMGVSEEAKALWEEREVLRNAGVPEDNATILDLDARRAACQSPVVGWYVTDVRLYGRSRLDDAQQMAPSWGGSEWQFGRIGWWGLEDKAPYGLGRHATREGALDAARAWMREHQSLYAYWVPTSPPEPPVDGEPLD